MYMHNTISVKFNKSPIQRVRLSQQQKTYFYSERTMSLCFKGSDFFVGTFFTSSEFLVIF